MENKTKWHHTSLGIIAVLVLFFPAGLYLMWRYAKWNVRIKSAISLFFLAVLLIANIDSKSKEIASEASREVKGQQNFILPSNSPTVAPTNTPTPAPTIQTYLVTYVIDGDTIEIEGGQRVRYIGIDTPETVHSSKSVQCYGQEASDKNKALVEGKRVRLEKDISETDQYGRLLRYVYTESEQFVNNILVLEGYAHSSTYPPDIKYQELFKASEQEARNANRGLWGASCTVSPTQKPVSIPTTAPTNTQTTSGSCKYSCSGSDKDCSDFSSHAEAQAFFNCCGFSATNDPMRLDKANGTGDGIACEGLK